jgi:tRNA pseudouridine55 synthase
VNAPRRPPRRRVDGVLLLDKPSGISSNDALQKAKRLFNAAKAGHTGTLDPLATGLLPLCFGEATKFAGELLNRDKTYRATVRLGITTDTADAEGAVRQTRPVAVTDAQLDDALDAFLGDIEQVPPMHSALKRDGKPLYEYARQGIELERSPRRVTVHGLKLLWRQDDHFEMEVSCSKGTYVRTLAADIGEALGCGAHLAALRRTRIGVLEIADAHSLAELEALAPEARDGLLLPVDTLLRNIDRADLSEAEMHRVLHGQAVRWIGRPLDRYRLYGSGGQFLGLAQMSADGWLSPHRLVAHSEATTQNQK